MPKFDIIFYETFQEEKEAILRHLKPTFNVRFTPHTIQEDTNSTLEASLISLRTQSEIPEAWAPSLSGILSRSTGYDHLQAYLKKTKQPLLCGYLPLYCARAVAEQTLLLWLSLMRKLPQQIHQFKSFKRDRITGQEAEHKNLLVIGVGNIGKEVLKIGQSLGMNTSGVDIEERYSEIKYTSLKESLPQADVIVCAMNLTEKNQGGLNYSVLSRAKPSALFINISRGELSPLKDLQKLLQENKLGGIALDVYEEEKSLAIELRKKEASLHPDVLALQELAKDERVILTPHNAFNTVEAVDRKALQSVQQFEHFINHKKFLWKVPH